MIVVWSMMMMVEWVMCVDAIGFIAETDVTQCITIVVIVIIVPDTIIKQVSNTIKAVVPAVIVWMQMHITSMTTTITTVSTCTTDITTAGAITRIVIFMFILVTPGRIL